MLMYSFPNLEPVHCSMSSSDYCFLICIKISQEAGKVVWYSHLLKNFLQIVVIHTVKGFSIVNEAEVDVLLEFPCFFYDSTDVGNLISGSSAFSKSSLNIWKLSVHILLKPVLEDFEHYFASVWDECNCVVVWTFFQFSSVAQLCPTLCDFMDCSTPGLPVHHQPPELTQTHVHWVSDAIQPSHLLLSPSSPTFNLSQHQGLFYWVSSSHQVAKVMEFLLQHQSFRWIFRTDFL